MKENIVKINTTNLIHNFLIFKKQILKNQLIYPVLKGDAYGISSILVASVLLDIQEWQEKSLFVFSVDEAIELRLNFDNKIKDIFVLSGIFAGQEDLFLKYKIIPVLNNIEKLKIWNNFAKKNNTKLDCVLQFNTGMNRNGFEINDIGIIQNEITSLNVKIVISHLGYANNPNSDLTKQQLKNFDLVDKCFPEANKSLLATEGILNLENNLYDIARLGAGLYGICTDKYLDKYSFKQVLHFKSLIEQKNNCLIINLGLNNGLPKQYSKNGYILVENKKIYIKEVLDNCTILATQNEEFIGKYADIISENLHIDKFASMCDTIGYEMQCKVLRNIIFNKDNFELVVDREIKHTREIENKILYNYEHNILTLKNYALYSKITEIRIVSQDGWVGYDAMRTVSVGDKLALVIGGYLDGISRKFSKDYFVFVNTKNGSLIKAEVFGRVSMDQFVIKVESDIEISIGDEVLICEDIRNDLESFFLTKRAKRIKSY